MIDKMHQQEQCLMLEVLKSKQKGSLCSFLQWLSNKRGEEDEEEEILRLKLTSKERR